MQAVMKRLSRTENRIFCSIQSAYLGQFAPCIIATGGLLPCVRSPKSPCSIFNLIFSLTARTDDCMCSPGTSTRIHLTLFSFSFFPRYCPVHSSVDPLSTNARTIILHEFYSSRGKKILRKSEEETNCSVQPLHPREYVKHHLKIFG
ncbi:hypothetical protein AV530_002086 [Patagioenas fasciata monilis]|uniref:Uncharacterized protein n=1 Tax=Patagioenas fasciata monilis TaxID=372326 RepID=A0A1V4J755_PATFA|nr:hypothetical protein AV530_002086 [Patagioenas fasciata monilis]